MIDSMKMSQIQEIQLILYDIHVEMMVLNEYFQVAAIIMKFQHFEKTLTTILDI
jgi:hypothetical protein